MATFLSTVAVLFFASVVTANLLVWNRVMAKTDGVSSWVKRNLPGINVLAIAGAAFLVGGLVWQVAALRTDFREELRELRTEMRTEVSALNNEVSRNPDSLKVQAALTRADLEYLRPRVVREDFENHLKSLTDEITRLTTELERLRARIAELEAEIARMRRS